MRLAVRGAGAQRQRSGWGGLSGVQQRKCQEADLYVCIEDLGRQQLLVQQRAGFELQYGGRLRDLALPAVGWIV